MIENIQKPQACRNAHCGAMCSPAQAEASLMVFKEPTKCVHYVRDDTGYDRQLLIDFLKWYHEPFTDRDYVFKDYRDVADMFLKERK